MSTSQVDSLNSGLTPASSSMLPWLWSTLDEWADQLISSPDCSFVLSHRDLKWDPGFQSKLLWFSGHEDTSKSVYHQKVWSATNQREADALRRLFEAGLALGLAIERQAEEAAATLPFYGMAWSIIFHGDLWMIAANSLEELADWFDASTASTRHDIEKSCLQMRGRLWNQWRLNSLGLPELAGFLWQQRTHQGFSPADGVGESKDSYLKMLEPALTLYESSRYAISRTFSRDVGMKEPRLALLEAQVKVHLANHQAEAPFDQKLVQRTLYAVENSLKVESMKAAHDRAESLALRIKADLERWLPASPQIGSGQTTAPLAQDLVSELGSIDCDGILHDWKLLQQKWVAMLEQFDQWSEQANQKHQHQEKEEQAGRFESLAEFAAGAGHELNNPLAVIQGRAQLLMAKTSDQATKASLKAIIDQTLRAHRMLRDLIFIARPSPPRPRFFRPADSLRNLLQEFKEDAVRLDVHLEVSICPLAARFETDQFDPDGFRHLCLSLVRNALDASRPAGRVSVGLRHEGSSLKLVVDDDGQGFDARESAHLFDPFYCGRKAGRGLGLGLPRLARVVAQMNGRVRYRSQLDRGSVFEVILPLAENMPQAYSTTA